MGRAPCCDKANVKKGPWSPEEDAALKSYIETNGTGGNWIALPQKIGLKRCGKSCRLRWLNYLRPNIKHGGFTEEEDNIICSLYISIGSRWSIIAAQLPGRTDNDIKNYWNTRLKKKLLGRRKQQSSSKDTNNGISTIDNNSCSSNNNNNALSSSAMERLQLHMQLQSLQNPFSFNNPALWPNKLHPFQEKIIQQSLIHQSDNNNNNNPIIMMMMMQNNNDANNHFDHDVLVVKNQQDDAAGTKIKTTPKVVVVDDDLAVVEKQNHPMMNNGSVSFIGSENNNNNNNNIPNIPMQSSNSSNVIAPMRGEGTVGIQQVCALQTELDDILNNRTSMDNYIPQVAAEFDCFREMNNNGCCSKDSLIWWSNDSGDTKSASSNSWDSSTTTPVLLPEGMFQDYELGYTL